MPLRSAIDANAGLKKFIHRLIVPAGHAMPRFWVRWFINPFFHKRGKKAIVRWRSRLDVFPWNRFELGAYSIVEDFAVINNGVGDVVIGHHTCIGLNNTIIGPVNMGNYVMLAQNIVISGLNHGFEDVSLPPRLQKVNTSPIIIENDVWIGANSVVTAGVTIGKHAVIGAGSVVTKNIPPYCVAVGNPARIIKRYDHDIGKWVKQDNAKQYA